MGGRQLWSRGRIRQGAAFALLLLVPASAAIYLGLELIREDRELVTRRGNERRVNAAELFATTLEQLLVASERQLASGSPIPGIENARDAYAVSWRRMESDDAASDFDEGEQLEFVERDLEAAASAYRRLTLSDRSPIRAGALVRLGRVERKQQRTDAALAVYRDLVLLESTLITGVPADLMGRRATCELLEEAGRGEVLRQTASVLHDDLVRLRWPVDLETWRLYLHQTANWAGRSPSDAIEGAADVLANLLSDWADSSKSGIRSGRTPLTSPHISALLLWHTSEGHLTALVAGPLYQATQWAEPAARGLRERSARAALVSPDGRRITGDPMPPATATLELTSEITNLPWNISVADDKTVGDPDQLGLRRETLIIGLGAVVVLVVVGGYLVARSVSQELRVAALQSDFVSAVSHEFRTPLTSLKQFTDLLNSDDEPNAEERRAFHAAQARATERLRRLVETLLDFGRMEAGARPYQLTTIRIGEVVARTVDGFRQEALPGGFSLVHEDTAPATAQVTVAGDRDAISLALWNLLDNAVKYSGDSREIRVTVEVATSAVVVGVHDKGAGIPQAEQAGLFGKFVRGTSSRSNTIPGTGLGLAMVKHIVDGHRGSVRIESGSGQGSTFYIELPTCRTS